jgi:hypothetical protein
MGGFEVHGDAKAAQSFGSDRADGSYEGLMQGAEDLVAQLHFLGYLQEMANLY